jgi:hypothetical protein
MRIERDGTRTRIGQGAENKLEGKQAHRHAGRTWCGGRAAMRRDATRRSVPGGHLISNPHIDISISYADVGTQSAAVGAGDDGLHPVDHLGDAT